MMLLFLVLFLTGGGLLVLLAIPLIQRKVAPNYWYGFRVSRTLENPDVWYPANAYAGWQLLWVGVAEMAVAAVAFFIPGIDLAWYASIVGVAVTLALAVAVLQSFAYLRKLPDKQCKDKLQSDRVE